MHPFTNLNPEAFHRVTTSVLLATFFVLSSAYAQTDTAFYDLGRTLLRKDFTAAVTFRGEELQRFFYGNAGEAIYSRLGSGETFIFVVDGQALNDISAYSIYDMKEIVLLEHAGIGLNGATGNKTLVLITTYDDEDHDNRLTVAAKGGYLSASDNNSYQQYYVGTRFKNEKLGGGISLDFLQDAPSIPASRYRARAFGRYDLATNHRLTAELLYSPSRVGGSNRRLVGEAYLMELTDAKQLAAQGRLRFNSRFAKRLQNELSVSYGWWGQEASWQMESSLPDQPGVITSLSGNEHRGRGLLITDRLRYTWQLGGHTVIVPQLHASWRNGNRKSTLRAYQFDGDRVGSGEEWTFWNNANVFSLTSSVSLSHKNYLQLDGGVLADLSPYPTMGIGRMKRSFPFVSGSVDLAQLLRPESLWQGQLFASYTASGWFHDELSMHSNDYNGSIGGLAILPAYVYYGLNRSNDRHDRMQLGVRTVFDRGKFWAQYSFGQMNMVSMHQFMMPGPSDPQAPFLPVTNQLTSHSLSLGTQWSTTEFSWRHGLRAVYWAETRSSVEGIDPNNLISLPERNPKSYIQWNQAFSHKRFFAGLDLMYFRAENYFNATQGSFGIRETTALQNAYIGYQLALPNGHMVEWYGYTRNPAESNGAVFLPAHRYYGVGLRFGGW